MRAVRSEDLMVAARALMAVEQDTRPWLARRMAQEARWADKYRKRFGRRHVLWGDGTLRGAAVRRVLAPERPLSDPACGAAMVLLLDVLVGRA